MSAFRLIISPWPSIRRKKPGRGQKIEISGFATRVDDEDGKVTVRIDGGGLVTVDADTITNLSTTSRVTVRE